MQEIRAVLVMCLATFVLLFLAFGSVVLPLVSHAPA